MHDIPLSLYIHLPWCERKCPYCDFNSHQVDVIPEQDYIDQLLADLDWAIPRIGDRSVQTLFIGGGTPSLFSGSAIDRLLNAIGNRLQYAPDMEATMEANPGSAEAEKFSAFRSAGINRLSLGVQAFNDNQLRTLGRVHSSEQAHRAIEMAVSAGFSRINIDLMHGLPEQTDAQALQDIQQAIAHNIEHLSWYQLTIEPNTAYYRTQPELPAEDTLSTIQRRGESLLHSQGFNNYEVSAWAKPGQACRHNLNYWSFGDYIAIGAGAHGKLSTANGEVMRYWQTRQPQHYLDRCAAQPAGQRVLSKDDLRFEFILNTLRLTRGFTLTQYEQRTGLDRATLEPELSQTLEQELLQQQGEHIKTTALGRRFLDTVTGLFLCD